MSPPVVPTLSSLFYVADLAVSSIELLRSLHVAQAWVCCLSVVLAPAARRVSLSHPRIRASLPAQLLFVHRVSPRRATPPLSSAAPSEARAVPTAARTAFIEPISFFVARSSRLPSCAFLRSPFVLPHLPHPPDTPSPSPTRRCFKRPNDPMISLTRFSATFPSFASPLSSASSSTLPCVPVYLERLEVDEPSGTRDATQSV